MKLSDHKIYLASKSPRRSQLLDQIGVKFDVLLLRDRLPHGPGVSEIVQPGELAADYVVRVAREKANFAWETMLARHLPLRPILSADTTVVLDGRIFGKPANPDEAFAMLQALAGRTHQVLTSVALQTQNQLRQITQRSDVAFAPISDDAIRAYCATAEPYDKAGGYAVQGHAAVFIQEIAGSYSGIMGLPLFETAQLLRQAGLPIS